MSKTSWEPEDRRCFSMNVIAEAKLQCKLHCLVKWNDLDQESRRILISEAMKDIEREQSLKEPTT